MPLRERSHETAARLSQIDYDREMTMIAWEGERVAGLARSAADPDFEAAEAAVIIRADLRAQGLATKLLQALFGAITAQGVRHAVMVYPAGLASLDAIGAELGFTTAPSPGDPAVTRATKALRKP
jgi:acetyltransferase